MEDETGLTEHGTAILREIYYRQQHGDHPSRQLNRADWDVWAASEQGLVEILKQPWLGQRPYRHSIVHPATEEEQVRTRGQVALESIRRKHRG